MSALCSEESWASVSIVIDRRCFGVQQLQCSMVVNRKLAWGCLLLGWLCQIIQVNLSMGLPIRKLHGMDYVEGLAISYSCLVLGVNMYCFCCFLQVAFIICSVIFIELNFSLSNLNVV